MTKILRLEMRGFKSFAQKTELVFGDKYNVVLGPNGSGKSNVLDALCFVLGKSSSREMRAEKSANLIYNGGKTKKPAKEGEVSIYFDNSKKIFPTDEASVKITRIVRPTGTSIYKINDQTRTRSQIIELLGLAKINPDGYNIILQGDVVRFVEMSSVERRQIIEQIAGISVYEERKNKALRELERVEEKLNEAGIILSERQSYLKELKKERDQALKYDDLRTRVSVCKASFLEKKIKSKEEGLEKYSKEIEGNRQKAREIQAEINKQKEEIQAKKDEIKAVSREVEEKGEKSQVALHKEIEAIRIELATGNQSIKTYDNEIQRVAVRKDQLYTSMSEIEQKISDMTAKVDELTEYESQKRNEEREYKGKISAFKEKYKLGDSSEIDKEIEGLDHQADDKQKEIQGLREEQQELFREKDRVEFKLSSIDEQVAKVKEIQKESEVELESLKGKKAEFKKTTVELARLLNEDTSIASQMATARARLLKIKEELAKITQQNITIRERFAGDLAIQKIVENRGTLKGVHGKVTDLGEVKKKYAVALEAAAGARVKSLVVETDGDAANCIKYLKQNRLGTATFLPINKIKGTETSSEARKLGGANGVHGLAVDLIKFEPKFKKIFQYVFGNTLVVDNIDVARRIGVGKIRMVTLEGDLTEMSGAMHGGFRQRKGGATFKQTELTSDLEKYEREEQDTTAVIHSLEAKKEKSEDVIAELRAKKAELEGEIIKIEKSLHLEDSDLEASINQKDELKKDLEEKEKRLDEIQNQLSELNRELAQLKIKKQELRSEISELRNPIKLAELNTFEEQLSTIKEELIKVESEKKNQQNQIQDILEPEKENIQKILKQHDREEVEFRQKSDEAKNKLKIQKEELKEKEKHQKEFYANFKQLFNHRNKLNEEIQKIENKLILKEEHARRAENKANTISIDHARVQAEVSGLQEEFKEFEGVKTIQNKSLEDLHLEYKAAQRSIDRMGNVNMKALEIYDAVETEYNNLLDKKERLETERKDVLVMMNEIESKKKELFLATFEQVNENFQTIFGELSTKGEASLILEEPDSPFDGGVRIRVRISGTKYLDIRGLSGGEKTMTALAFIFSIQDHDPASFYVMDEVDAALDKRNSEKLAVLIKKYCDRAQYVIISHNDGVISSADHLYGVSMNEHGMSKVVSLKV